MNKLLLRTLLAVLVPVILLSGCSQFGGRIRLSDYSDEESEADKGGESPTPASVTAAPTPGADLTALNSLFAVSLFDYEERDIAYQFQSNCHQVMIECLGDEYDLSDYVLHSVSYYAGKLDEHNGNNNYASVIFRLMNAMADDYYTEYYERDAEVYYPIYDYIAEMYYERNITPDMTYEQALQVADTLVERITYDVPPEYNVDPGAFYAFLDEWCAGVGIQKAA